MTEEGEAHCAHCDRETMWKHGTGKDHLHCEGCNERWPCKFLCPHDSCGREKMRQRAALTPPEEP